MSRTSRVPYHQNVYDLLGIEPGKCPNAARMIAEHEAVHGPLPASVREWYLLPNMTPRSASRSIGETFVTWDAYGDVDWPTPLGDLLFRFSILGEEPSWRFVCFAYKSHCESNWWLDVDGTADPPVWNDNGSRRDPQAWSRESRSFSEFLASWFTAAYARPDTPFSPDAGADAPPKPYHNGLWLRAPAEPFEPAVIDFLREQLGEPERTPRPGDVTTFTFRVPGGVVRVTADAPTHAAGLSAWWLHADMPERLGELARLVIPFGTLRDTLRADTEPARAVLSLIGCGRGS